MIYRLVGRCFLESFYVAFFKKRPLIQRAVRWSPPQGRNLLYALSFLPSEGCRLRLRLSAAKQFSFALLLPKKKADKRFGIACVERGTPHLCDSSLRALPEAASFLRKHRQALPTLRLGIHPSVALGKDKESFALASATADRGGSDKPLKRLERNFQKDTAVETYKLQFSIFIPLKYNSPIVYKKCHGCD